VRYRCGQASSPGLPLPSTRYRHPETLVEQLRRRLDLHERGSAIVRALLAVEGRVSDEVFADASELGNRLDGYR